MSLGPQTAAIRRLLPPEEQGLLFIGAGHVELGDEPVPFTAPTNVGERVEIVGYHFDPVKGTLPILDTATRSGSTGPSYIAWASPGKALTRFDAQQHLDPSFLQERLDELRNELAALTLARGRVRTGHGQDELLLAIAPVEVDAYLIQSFLEDDPEKGQER